MGKMVVQGVTGHTSGDDVKLVAVWPRSRDHSSSGGIGAERAEGWKEGGGGGGELGLGFTVPEEERAAPAGDALKRRARSRYPYLLCWSPNLR